ncbi:Protein of unknown function [Gryllus bimaculatus]|nr:Protein of unknown function [Gryllus bimaculatus]
METKIEPRMGRGWEREWGVDGSEDGAWMGAKLRSVWKRGWGVDGSEEEAWMEARICARMGRELDVDVSEDGREHGGIAHFLLSRLCVSPMPSE